MSKTLLLYNEITSNKEPFYQISNFLSKFSQREDLLNNDVSNIKSHLLNSSDDQVQDLNLALAKYISKHRANFRGIRTPEKLYESIKELDIIFCVFLKVELLDDITHLNSFMLIKQFYDEYRIILLLEGTDPEYHKSSHYFYTVTEDNSIYNDIYFIPRDGGNIKRLQTQSVGALGSFLPLQLVNHDLMELLTANLSTYISRDWIDNLLMNKPDWSRIGSFKLLHGCMKILHEHRNCFVDDIKKMVAEKIISMNVFSWIFLAFFLKGQGKIKITIDNLNTYIDQMKLYTTGCLQLLENIIFHSQKKTGIFSFRIYNQKEDYIIRRYGELAEADNSLCMEVMIADYAGGADACNIARHFAKRIEDAKLVELFSDFTPLDFFIKKLTEERREKIDKCWISYYEKEKNIGRHFGIRIFENIVLQSKGIVSLESHSTHQAKEGESSKKEGENCLPGTSYSVLLPIRELQKSVLSTEIGIDKDIEIEDLFHKYVNYSKKDKTFLIDNKFYSTQQEKEGIIYYLMNEILESGKSADLCYISAKEWQYFYGELICKAVLLARYKVKRISYLVIYDCKTEFINSCIHTISSVFKNIASEPHYGNDVQIVLYKEDTYDEVVLVPGSYEETIRLNEQINFSKGMIPDFEPFEQIELSRQANKLLKSPVTILPFDVLHPVKKNDEVKTLFEYYAKGVIERDIQNQAFGCKIDKTHMRLGSTIHVDLFYEAELLLGNKLFVSRFAYLIAEKLIKKIKDNKEDEEITIYGYATYSELLIFKIMNILKHEFGWEDGGKGKIHIDYAILEREMENRGDSHVDRIRYSTYFPSEEIRQNYFKDRKLVCILPIASTLKTSEKLISLFCKDNPTFCPENILEHYVLILVGSKKANRYWEIEGNRIKSDSKVWKGIFPRFLVNVDLSYEEARDCNMCFPKDNSLMEYPLIEVNAASTIPNQAFGLYGDQEEPVVVDWKKIENEEKLLSCLEDSLVYAHIRRGENHFLYYFQTEKLIVKYNREVEEWLEEEAGKIQISNTDYHVIFCPSHFSNAGFLELVNRIIFKEAAIIIRDDVDKEYRSNIVAKYSNIQLLFAKLETLSSKPKMIRFYYVDDSIISGRTYFRSKSLVESIAELYMNKYENISVHIFEKIFVLVDRNSSFSRMQYVRGWDSSTRHIDAVKSDFFAFRTVNISSLRNHGDSCTICKLESEADILYRASVTKKMSRHWKDESEKFRVKSLKDYLQNYKKDDEKRKRAYRRLVCTHIAHTFLSESNHGNHKESVINIILQLLITDYEKRKENRFEYFLSYLKVISRPFVVFTKAVKESIFDILLILAEWLLTQASMEHIYKDICTQKDYLQKAGIKKNFIKLERVILSQIKSEKENKEKDLLILVFKQLTELKSNYVIRLENINKFVGYVNAETETGTNLFQEAEKQELFWRYLVYVKQLIGVNSDTSKSAWLDYALHNSQEIGNDNKIQIQLPDDIKEMLYVENTRVFYDGIKKLGKIISCKEIIEYLCNPQEHDGKPKPSKVISLISSVEKAFEDDFQFGNFIFNQKDYGYIEQENHVEGMRDTDKVDLPIISNELSILSAIALQEILESDSKDGEEISKKYRRIVCLLGNILQADCVRIVMAIDAEYDKWETVVCERFNEICDIYDNNHKERKVDKLKISPKKEYVLLTDSDNNDDEWQVVQEFDQDMTERLIDYSAQGNRSGYEFDRNRKFLIWEMDNGVKHPIFLYVKWEKMMDETVLNRVKSSMIFYYLLNKNIFNNENDGQLYDLIINRRAVRLIHDPKANTHTEQKVRWTQYEKVVASKDSEIDYRLYILTLLADLTISETYLESSRSNFYLSPCDTKFVRWDDVSNIFIKLNTEKSDFEKEADSEKNIGLLFKDSTGESTSVKVELENIFEFDQKIEHMSEILCYNITEGGSKFYLFLYSLVMNAGIKKRSKIEQNRANSKYVTVYLSKTEGGDIRISNIVGENIPSVQDINNEIKVPPANSDKGITLWSVSRYVKSMKASLLKECHRMIEKLEIIDEDIIADYKEVVGRLLSEEFDVRVEELEYNNEKYFSILLPVVKEKYSKVLELIKNIKERVERKKNEKTSAD